MDMERRSYKRIDDSIQVKFVMKSDKWGSIPYDTSYTKNISGGGFLFNSKIPINVGEIIEVKFYIQSRQEFVMAVAKVVRVIDIVENKLYEIGIQFLSIKDDDEKMLLKYVSKVSIK